VLWKQEPALSGLLNACLNVMLGWRRMHQKRGALNLKSRQPERELNYASSGGVIALEAERISRFETAMQERMDETRLARHQDPAVRSDQSGRHETDNRDAHHEPLERARR
jgi:hypothetical protein